MRQRSLQPHDIAPAAYETIGILGGSFNPPHDAHVDICRQALDGGHVQRVIVVPAYRHPFGKPLAPFAHRMAMVRLAFEPFGDKVEVSDIEGALSGVSYTIDTVRALRRRHRNACFRLLLGADVLAELPKWKDIRQLLRLAPALVFPRAGSPVPTLPRGLSNIEVVGMQPPDVSSSGVRQQLADGADKIPAVPAAVMDYILKHGLYRSSA